MSGALVFSGLSLLSQTAIAAPVEIFQTSRTDATYAQALDAYEAGDKSLALIRAKLAAAKGDTQAQVMAGHILMRGEAGFIDTRDAVQFFRLAAKKDDTDALVALGELALREQADLTPQDAQAYLVRAAALGRTDAMRVLGDMYARGKGVEVDPEQSEIWMTKAAQDHDVLAARQMGEHFMQTDPNTALSWYEKAAAQGDAQSAYIAAVMYAENFDVKPNPKKAAVLMRQAAEANIAAAQADYGLLVYQGAGVPQSTEDAAHWFERSAKGGDREGQFLYAFTLARGEGVEKSFEDAYYWLLKNDGQSGIDSYDKDRETLKKRLEEHVDPAILKRARERIQNELR